LKEFKLETTFYSITVYNCDIFKNSEIIPNNLHLCLTDPPYNKQLSKFEANEKKDATKDDKSWDSINYSEWHNFTVSLYDKLLDGGHFIFFGDVGKISEFIINTDKRFVLKTVGRWEKGMTMFFSQNRCGSYVEKRLSDDLEYTAEKSNDHNGKWGFYNNSGKSRRLILKKEESIYWNNYGANPIVTWESIAFMKKQNISIADTLLKNVVGGYRRRDGIGIIPLFVVSPDTTDDHLTPKPLKLMTQLLEYVIPFDYPFDNNYVFNIIDPFLGSGSTLISAMQLAQHFHRKVNLYGVEIRESAFDIAIKKIEKAHNGLKDPLSLFRNGA